MTANDAVRILARLQVCVDTDACNADCEACMYGDDDAQIHEALDMAMEAVKIVHCKDCQFYNQKEPGSGMCIELAMPGMKDDDFCSRGVRRQNG